MLRSLSLILLFASISGVISAQQFQNGNFETLVDCPESFDFDLAITTTLDNWISIQGTSDGWHEECPAIAGSTNGAVPAPFAGNGYGGFYVGEAMAQELTLPIQAQTPYCINFDGYLAPIGGGIPDDLSCFRLCLYGSNTAPVAAGGFDIPTPVADMQDTELLAWSETFNDSEEWGAFEFSFESETSYAYMIVTGFQEGDCMLAGPYICVDNMSFIDCGANNIDDQQTASFEVYPNPTSNFNAWTVRFNEPISEGSALLYTANGKLLLDIPLKGEKKLDIQTNGLEAGTYLLVCDSPLGKHTKTLVIQ
jgi:hypothetical protein